MASDANSVFGNSLGGSQASNLSDPLAPGGAFGIPTANSFDFDKYGIPKEGSFNLGSSVIPTSNTFDFAKYGIPNEGSLNLGSSANSSIPNFGASNGGFPIA